MKRYWLQYGGSNKLPGGRGKTMRIPAIKSITDLAREAKLLVAQARESQEPIVITQRGREVAVLLPIELYRQLQEARTYHIMSPQGGRTYRIMSPRLVNREDAALFKKIVAGRTTRVAEEPGAGV